MTKSFVALKGFSADLKSAWTRNPLLCQQYVVGERVKCVHPQLPFFICGLDAAHGSDLVTGCSPERYGIVQVFTKDVRKGSPWSFFADESGRSLEAVLSDCTFREYKNFSADRVKLLTLLPNNCDFKTHLEGWARSLKVPALSPATWERAQKALREKHS